MDDLDKELDELLKDEAPANGEGENSPPLGAGDKAPPQGDLKIALRKSRDRSRALAEENARLKTELEEHKQKPLAPQPKADDLEERVDLRLSGYSKEEIDFVNQNRKDNQTLGEAAKDPFVVAAIEGIRAKGQIKEATPPPSSRLGVTLPQGKKPRELSPRERAQLQEDILRKKKQQGILK